MLLKKCSSCGEHKPADLEHFTSNAKGKYGLRGQCKPCWQERARYLIKLPHNAAKRKEIRERARDSGREAELSRARRKANPSSAREAQRKSRAKRKDVNRALNAKWRKENPEKISAIRKRTAEKLKQNPGYVLHRRIKARVRALLKGKSFGVVKDLLGYSKEELVAHIEAQFTEGMSWDVLSTGAIHIDHIRPVSSFDFTTENCQGFKDCWALSNLRPLWALDNQKKGCRLESSECPTN